MYLTVFHSFRASVSCLICLSDCDIVSGLIWDVTRCSVFQLTIVPGGADPVTSKPIIPTVHVPGTRGKCI